jgi:malonyl-CoA O-methyltransferase
MTLSPRKQIRASFSKAAPSYAKAASHQKQMAQFLLDIFESQIALPADENARVLDLGSGTGFVSHGAKNRDLIDSSIRLDISESMLRQDEELGQSDELLCADLENLPLLSESIDVCLSSYAFQWAHDLPFLFEELNRVMKPGAKLFFSIPGEKTFHELKDAWKDVDEGIHVHEFWHQQKVLDSANEKGFECLHFSQRNDVLSFDTLKRATGHIKNIGAHNLDANRAKHLLGKAQYFAFRKAFKEKSAVKGAYSLTYQSYFFAFEKVDS